MNPDLREAALPPWLRAASLVPFGFWYALSDVLAFIAAYIGFHRRARVREQLRQNPTLRHGPPPYKPMPIRRR